MNVGTERHRGLALLPLIVLAAIGVFLAACEPIVLTPMPVESQADRALWQWIDAAEDADLAHRTVTILQRQPWWNGEVILFTYQDRLPDSAGGGRINVLNWVLVEPDEQEGNWQVRMSGNQQKAHWPANGSEPMFVDTPLFSFLLSEREDGQARQMSVIYGIWLNSVSAPDTLRLVQEGVPVHAPLRSKSFLYVTEGFSNWRSGLTYTCQSSDGPRGGLCAVGLSNDNPPPVQYLDFADELRLAPAIDSVSGRLLPFHIGDRSMIDPFAPATLPIPVDAHSELYWQVLAEPSADWQVSIRLEDATGAMALEIDAPIQWPEPLCEKQGFGFQCEVKSTLEFHVPADFPTGLYTITVALVDPATGELAPVTSPADVTAPAVVGQVRVVSMPDYLERQTYCNPDYGFSFSYPSDWQIEERPHFVQLHNGDLALSIGFKRVSENVNIVRTGVAAGDLLAMGAVPFLGRELSRDVLVYRGQEKAVLYAGAGEVEIGDLIFSLGLDKSALGDYESFAIDQAMQAQANAIVRSFVQGCKEATP